MALKFQCKIIIGLLNYEQLFYSIIVKVNKKSGKPNNNVLDYLITLALVEYILLLYSFPLSFYELFSANNPWVVNRVRPNRKWTTRFLAHPIRSKSLQRQSLWRVSNQAHIDFNATSWAMIISLKVINLPHFPYLECCLDRANYSFNNQFAIHNSTCHR